VHRKILHVDVDAFMASVEQRDRPQLRGRPVAVAGADGRVAATSHEARKHGVRVGMAAKAALQRCPELVLLPVDFHRYRAVSQQLHAILGDFSRRIESVALDRCWLDLTDKEPGRDAPTAGHLRLAADANRMLVSGATAAARRIRERVHGELGLTCSIGVAPTKLVAQIASNVQKPNGLTVVQPEAVTAFLHPLPVSRLSGIGKATTRRLGEHGVYTVGDLAKLSEQQVVAVLGRSGAAVWRLARGDDPRAVTPDRGRRTRGTERTFPVDVGEKQVLEREVERQVRELAIDLATASERVRTVTMRLRYADFEATTRSRTLDTPTADPVKLGHVARALLHDHTDLGGRPVRLVGVSLSGVSAVQPTAQLDLPLR
jgi:DNA polymerase-4